MVKSKPGIFSEDICAKTILYTFACSTLSGHFTEDCFYSNWPGLDQIVSDQSMFLIGPSVVLNRLRGSGEDRVLTLRRNYARPPVESDRGYTKAPEGGRDKGTFRGPSDDQDDHGTTVFDRLLFFNMFKHSSRSLFRYSILGGLRRSHQIFPEGIG